MIKAIWVRVDTGDVAEVDITGDTLEAMQHAVGGLIELALTLSNGDQLFVNEEAKVNGVRENWQMWESHARMFKGNGIVVGPVGPEGETTSCNSDKDEVTEVVLLVEPEDVEMFLMSGVTE